MTLVAKFVTLVVEPLGIGRETESSILRVYYLYASVEEQ